jgi:hypothetical protein
VEVEVAVPHLGPAEWYAKKPSATPPWAIASDTHTSVIHELDIERVKADAASALVPRRAAR